MEDDNEKGRQLNEKNYEELKKMYNEEIEKQKKIY